MFIMLQYTWLDKINYGEMDKRVDQDSPSSFGVLVVFHLLACFVTTNGTVLEAGRNITSDPFHYNETSFKNSTDLSPEDCFNETCGCPYDPLGPLVHCSFL